MMAQSSRRSYQHAIHGCPVSPQPLLAREKQKESFDDAGLRRVASWILAMNDWLPSSRRAYKGQGYLSFANITYIFNTMYTIRR